MTCRNGKFEQRTSVAVANEPGFAVVPLRDPSKLTWTAFLKAIRRAIQKNVIEDVDPLLAISNLGMFGVKEFAAIVPPSAPLYSRLDLSGNELLCKMAPSAVKWFAP
jgi:hypothetical protein